MNHQSKYVKPKMWHGIIKEAQPGVGPEVLGLEWAGWVCLALPGLLEPAGEWRCGLDTHSSGTYTLLTHTSVLVSDIWVLCEVIGRFKSDSWEMSGKSALCPKRKQVLKFNTVKYTETKLNIFWEKPIPSTHLALLGFFQSFHATGYDTPLMIFDVCDL